MKARTIRNGRLSLSVDDRGRVVSLRNLLTKTELVTHPAAAEAWRLILPSGRHTVDFVCGSQVRPGKIELVREPARESIVIRYDTIGGGRRVHMKCVYSLEGGDGGLAAWVELENRAAQPIDEVEFPVIGGLGGFPARRVGRTMELVVGGDLGAFHGDVLNRGLPETGREANHYCRENETAMFEPVRGWLDGCASVWLDLCCQRQGIYLGRHEAVPGDFAFKIEKYPKEVPNAPAHCYPEGTPRWLRVHALHVPRLAPGGRWVSSRVIVHPHRGDWHAGADLYAAFRHAKLRLANPPAWMDDFVGWTEILGKTYLGEVYHDYRKCARDVVKDAKVTGIRFVFYYGHTAIGAEGGDLDQGPARALGGENAFRTMLDTLHQSGIRVMLLDHLHRWVNRDLPQYGRLRLERYAVLDENRRPRTARWWKETFLSCRRLEGPTPEWVEMCPACGPWRKIYLDQVTKLVRLGVDGLELDTFAPGRCYSRDHGHPVGAAMVPWKLEFVGGVREHVKKLNADFVLFGETMDPETREVLDGFYPNRYPDENGRIFRYLFPEITQQAVLVGNYAYDQVNKALLLGIGVETEIWGLRKTTLAGCPELARYIGEVNRFRRKHADILIRGTFRDTVGARVRGDVFCSVLDAGPRGRALVLRNPHDRTVRCSAGLVGARGKELRLWRPLAGERSIRRLPVVVTLKPYGAAVLLAL